MREMANSPMMIQYFEIKDTCPDYIVFYRLGDFYEMFFDDALLASKELDLVLTGRECGGEKKAPMCGIPFHSAEGYIAKLISNGHKVAICEQIEDAKASKGIVRRAVVRKLTPGTVMESSMLSDGKNNYVCAVYTEKNTAGICFADISTGEVTATFFENSKNIELDIINEISRFMPREILLCDNTFKQNKTLEFLKDKVNIEQAAPFRFICDNYQNFLKQKFTYTNVEFSNINIFTAKTITCIISYLKETSLSELANINTLNIYTTNIYMDIDANSRKNLELCENSIDKSVKNTILSVLNKTKTAMGSRLIRSWIEKPLINLSQIQKRQIAVDTLISDFKSLDNIRDSLVGINDIERLISRIVYGAANGRDLLGLSKTIEKLPNISNLISKYETAFLKDVFLNIDTLDDVKSLIDIAISDEAPASLRDSGIIRDGFSEELDDLREISTGGQTKILEIETRERATTGIKNLKVSYNKVAGYFIEITKLNSASVPSHYIRRQTMANAERYITDELKSHEDKVLAAREKIFALEISIFKEICQKVAQNVHRVQKTASSIAALDTIVSLAIVAKTQSYVKPDINIYGNIEIKDGRHPVIEQIESMFIPNDTMLDTENNRFSIITGPNMAGKSTYMRQVAIITIMAQIGSYVPAKSASISICDKIFTRIGASDDLSGGKSTFMVEMSEVSYILNNATKNSLIILDEIGRGTSTYDGMAIARAVSEYISKYIKSKTLFATHYHELSELEDSLDGIRNYNIAVSKQGDDIIFLRKIVHGSADRSYGIEVAKLAGISPKVINRAWEILKELENSDSCKIIYRDAPNQISIMDNNMSDICNELKNTDVNSITPMQALTLIHTLKSMIKD